MAICHDVDYAVRGDDLQFVEIGLDTGETVVAEAGAMMFLVLMELIPDALDDRRPVEIAWSFLFGFCLMILVQVII